jgi:hypothetical protein
MEISRRLRNLLMDHRVGASVLREIESEFEGADIAPGSPPEEIGPALGQRRTLVQTYYNGLDFSAPADIRKFLNVLSVFMANLERQLSTASPWASQTDDSYARQQFDKFQQQLGRDGYPSISFIDWPHTLFALPVGFSDCRLDFTVAWHIWRVSNLGWSELVSRISYSGLECLNLALQPRSSNRQIRVIKGFPVVRLSSERMADIFQHPTSKVVGVASNVEIPLAWNPLHPRPVCSRFCSKLMQPCAGKARVAGIFSALEKIWRRGWDSNPRYRRR